MCLLYIPHETHTHTHKRMPRHMHACPGMCCVQGEGNHLPTAATPVNKSINIYIFVVHTYVSVLISAMLSWITENYIRSKVQARAPVTQFARHDLIICIQPCKPQNKTATNHGERVRDGILCNKKPHRSHCSVSCTRKITSTHIDLRYSHQSTPHPNVPACRTPFSTTHITHVHTHTHRLTHTDKTTSARPRPHRSTSNQTREHATRLNLYKHPGAWKGRGEGDGGRARAVSQSAPMGFGYMPPS